MLYVFVPFSVPVTCNPCFSIVQSIIQCTPATRTPYVAGSRYKEPKVSVLEFSIVNYPHPNLYLVSSLSTITAHPCGDVWDLTTVKSLNIDMLYKNSNALNPRRIFIAGQECTALFTLLFLLRLLDGLSLTSWLIIVLCDTLINSRTDYRLLSLQNINKIHNEVKDNFILFLVCVGDILWIEELWLEGGALLWGWDRWSK